MQPVDLSQETVEPTVAGVRIATTAAGIRYAGRDDLVLFELAPGSHTAATFTRNAFCAAPVTVAKIHRAAQSPRYWLINSGNANAGTGQAGLLAALASCQAVADVTGCNPAQVLPFSTGVIGEDLPVDKISAALPGLRDQLAPTNWSAAARAIMTTDTRPKLVTRQFQVGERTATLVGIAKGAGMIRPDMATMLAFLATDVAVAPAVLQTVLSAAVDQSFNCITIDGDTSTNDACVLVATGELNNAAIDTLDSAAAASFSAAVAEACLALATAIVRDGEGATKLVQVVVEGAQSAVEARLVADAIAHSPLVKTALSAGDPNWGRILAAVGRAGLTDLVIEQVAIWLDQVCIVRNGGRDANYREADGQRVMALDEFTIRVTLGRGTAAVRVLTCDLTCEYVRINAAYRT
ncbi:bifunctional glutamate N-acetyltransferase/amino-acid acetyltransferase ArgJ [Thiospirillum jenense]|uniref:Arginine biosynthesis bifunctional protein ArgJ n=1 Tax=Thiospirillum jenense TaxID=1653858 RepID=A0A839HEE9_9GAMM|nr:bifunctional glutamate N-acetyltransferase/amino-acid acetyltransferase ArgJ [Thiospirillum jenense]MBB1125389.1 bifunctional glutamate N-acetyltransferase/amino-acid acetyltransferase ArgJ [Thiospirillum jenense]